MNNSEKFDVISVELTGKKTIEASAGTGKTYSLAILVVRLLLEKQIPIEQILLVTFTDTAAAELKERTNKFIRLALKEAILEGSSGDTTIQAIVNKPTLIKTDKKAILQKALLDIDKATMATIHSFCQQTLTEFAFETGQTFGKELLKNLDDIIRQEVFAFMRTNDYQQNYEFLKELGVFGSSFFVSTVQNRMAGLGFFEMINAKNQVEVNDLEGEKRKKVTDIFDSKLDQYRAVVEKTNIPRFPKKNTLESLSSGDTFYDCLLKTSSEKLPILFAEEIKMVRENGNEIANIKKYVAHYHINIAADKIIANVVNRLKQKNALTFNDLIDALYQKRENSDLIKLMRDKYKAVFVDEFQDTDPKQYGIFKCFFQNDEETVLFFIGDPKQSIYGWRQADVATYKEARDSTQRLEMNTNFRSSSPFISAANSFFKLDKNAKLEYIEVEANNDGKDVGVKCAGEIQPAIQILNGKEDAADFIKKVIVKLFNKETTLNNHELSPESLAVLVRTGREAAESKRVLDKLRIPSIVITDQSIFNTQEAKNLKIILNAVLNINQGNVYYALITSLVGMKISDLKQVNEDVVFPIFYECKAIWQRDGVSKMMATFMQAFDVISKHREDIIQGHQILANTKQLIDILQRHTIEQALTPSEVFQFLSNQIKNPDKNNEAYQQSVENDEKAVKIMTIHKSKGLEFDVVVLPYLNLTIKEKGTYTTFRKDGKYFFTLNGTEGEPKKLFTEQEKEENERLLYVAITRAKYNAFLYGKNGNHLLAPYLKGLSSTENLPDTIGGCSLAEFSDLESGGDFIFDKTCSSIQSKKTLKELVLADKNHFKLSYSFLASKHQHHSKEDKGKFEENSYDYFIFKELPRGAHIGNVLHEIFEFSDFTNDVLWSQNIEKALGRYYPSSLQEENMKKRYINNLLHLMRLTVNTSFEMNGQAISLNQIGNHQKVNELEFNFPIPKIFNSSKLESIINSSVDQRKISANSSQVYGMMNGFVDLFFEFNGKYYILDWKSNFLGDDIKDYSADGLLQGMNESNYHLQYLLYAVAMDKYLKNRLGEKYTFEQHFGGVAYVFLRGVRAGEKSGFFVQNVTRSELENLKQIMQLD